MQCFLCPALDWMDSDPTPPAFNPDDISTILQNLGSPLSYADSPLGTIPVLESSIGEVGIPRGQSCVQFDGSNDYAVIPNVIRDAMGFSATWTFATQIRIVSLPATRSIVLECNRGANDRLQLQILSTGRFVASKYNGSVFVNRSSDIMTVGTWVHLALVSNGSSMDMYINGVLQGGTTGAITNTILIASIGSSSGSCNANMHDARIYSTTKTVSELLAIYNQHITPDTVDTTNALGIYPLQEESGTKCYDVSGNGNDLTATNVDVSTFRTTDSGVKYSYPNEFGYTDDAGTIIPADLANPTLDCEGDALETPGPIWLPGAMGVNAFTGNGSNVYADCGASIEFPGAFSIEFSCYLPTIAGGALITKYSASGYIFTLGFYLGDFFGYVNRVDGAKMLGISATAPSTNSWHRIVFSYTPASGTYTDVGLSVDGVALSTSNQSVTTALSRANGTPLSVLKHDVGLAGPITSNVRIAGLKITTDGVTYYPLFDQCGPGSLNTNRDFYIVGSDGSATLVTGGVVNGTISDIYANKCPHVEDWCIKYGGGIAANGSFVPGIPGSGNDAAGNAKTLAVGKRGNPYSKLLRNYFSAPALVNIGCTSSDKEAPGYDVQSESVANTRFRRTAANGDDRDLSFSEAQAGTNLANIEEWVTP